MQPFNLEFTLRLNLREWDEATSGACFRLLLDEHNLFMHCVSRQLLIRKNAYVCNALLLLSERLTEHTLWFYYILQEKLCFYCLPIFVVSVPYDSCNHFTAWQTILDGSWWREQSYGCVVSYSEDTNHKQQMVWAVSNRFLWLIWATNIPKKEHVHTPKETIWDSRRRNFLLPWVDQSSFTVVCCNVCKMEKMPHSIRPFLWDRFNISGRLRVRFKHNRKCIPSYAHISRLIIFH